MKHLILLSLFTLHSVLFTLSASAAVPLHWTVETSRAVPAQFEAYQGETLALEAALQSYGKPLEAPLNYSFYWQTNGMGNAWWSTNCTPPTNNQQLTTNNLLRATWTPSMETGAKVYNCFIGKPGTIYHAAFQLRLRPSPGATPNELPLPQKVIDFAKVTVLNPPLSGGGGGGVDTNAVERIANRAVETNAVTVGLSSSVSSLQSSKADKSTTYTKTDTDAKLSPIEAQIAALQDGKADKSTTYTKAETDAKLAEKRDKTDFNIEGIGNWFHGELPEGVILSSEQPNPLPENDDLIWSSNIGPFLLSDGVHKTNGIFKLYGTDEKVFSATRIGVVDRIAKYSELTAGLAEKQSKITATGILKGDGQGGVSAATKSSTSADPANADYRDPTDNTCHRTEFGEWVAHDVPAGFRLVGQPFIGDEIFRHKWVWNAGDGVYFQGTEENPDGSETNETFYILFATHTVSFTATRTAVCTDGKKFVTSDVVDGKVSAAISTNNPAFSNAVDTIVRSLMPTTLRAYDPVRQCWWNIQPVNGVLTLTVED